MTKKLQDPYFAEEAKKYQNPIPSRKFIATNIVQLPQPVSLDLLLQHFGVEQHQQRIGFKRRLRAMVREGELLQDKKRRYYAAESLTKITGKVIANRNGYGFLTPDDFDDDFYISNKQMKKLLHNDEVVAKIIPGRRNTLEAKIIEITKPTNKIIGQVMQQGELVYVQSDLNPIHQIYLANEDLANVNAGDKVSLELVTHPFLDQHILARLTKVYTNAVNMEMMIDILLANHQIPVGWNEEILAATADYQTTLPAMQQLADLTKLPFITIDGSDAKDLDDAVYCEVTTGGWNLYVAIAHVSHYVAPNSPIDIEAGQRGNSTYFPEYVVPMLPEVLSNDLCSLNPQQEKLVLVARMFISNNGKIGSAKFMEAKIISQAQLTYDEVNDFFNGVEHEKITPLIKPSLLNLYDLYQQLSMQRQQRHALDLEIPETKIIFTKEQTIQTIALRIRNIAHKIIEECMLAANVAAADFLLQHVPAGLFRNHAAPDAEKVAELANYFSLLGVQNTGLQDNADFAKAIQQLIAREDANILQMLILHTMQQANYQAESLGHFGLALKNYTHFTSPIRRYSDLVVHRLICSVLRRESSPYSLSDLQAIAATCSVTERRSEKAERELISWLKCQYMVKHVGEEYLGIISGVTDFGFFVTLPDFHVDGLVHVSTLKNDYYKYYPKRLKLVGERTGVSYQLGDQLQIVVANVNLELSRIDFNLL